MNNIVLIQISGDDSPGLTASLMEVLAQFEVEILDIGQAVVHNTLSLAMLVKIGPGEDGVLKEVLFHLHKARVTPVDDDEYLRWVGGRGKSLYVITVFGREVTPDHMARVAKVISDHGLNIDEIHRQSGRVPLDPALDQHRRCVELVVRGTAGPPPVVS